MNTKKGNADLWWVVAVVAGMWVVWVLSGGPGDVDSNSHPFIDPPPPLGTGRTYGEGFDFLKPINFSAGYSPIGNISISSYIDRSDNVELPDGAGVGNNSIYFAQVRISEGGASSEYQPGKEYVILQADYSNKAPINISGWYLKNGKDQRFSVPNYPTNKTPVADPSDVAQVPGAVQTFMANGSNQNVTPIILPPGSEAIITTGTVYSGNSFPINASFRVNKCSGYLEDLKNYNFYPSLNSNCPNPEDEPEVRQLDEECRDFVEGYPRCRTPEFKRVDGENLVDGSPLDLSRLCRDFMTERFNYNTCVTRHAGDSDFLVDEWRVYLGRRWELWAEEDEVITLYDNFGRMVDEVEY